MWWRPDGVVGVADVHAGALADRLETLEDFDVFGGVVATPCPSLGDLGMSGFSGSARRARFEASGSIPQSTLWLNI